MRTHRIFIPLLCLFLLSISSCLSVVYAERFYAYRFTSENGLPDNNVRCMALDDKGYLWLGTPNGLYRFDGYFYTAFRHEADNSQSLENNHINALVTLSTKMLLIRQQDDIYSLYDIEREAFADIRLNDAAPRFRHYKEVDGSLWLWNDGGAAVCYQVGEDRTVSYSVFNSEDVPVAVYEDAGYKKAEQLTRMADAENQITDNRGNPCVITNTGLLYWIDRTSGRMVTMHVFDKALIDVTSSRKYTVVTTKDGARTWVSTNGCGLTLYDHTTQTERHLRQPNGYTATDNLVAMIMDEEDNIFVADDAHGIACIASPKSMFDYVLLKEGSTALLDNRITVARWLNKDSIVLVNTVGEMYLCDSTLRLHRQDAYRGLDVHCAKQDASGRLWIGSRKRGLRTPQGRWYAHESNNTNSPSSNNISDLLFDARGRLWIANYRQPLDMAERQGDELVFRHFLPESSGIRLLYEDSHGRIWVGGCGFVWCFRPDELVADASRYRLVLDEDDTEHTDISTIREDAQGRIWIATLGSGIFMLDKPETNSYRHIGTQDGLVSDDVHSILIEDDMLHAATQRGLSSLDLKTMHVTHLYDNSDMLHNIYTDNTALRLPDGRLLFGTYNGVAVLPEQFEYELPKRAVRVTDLLVNDERWPASMLDASLEMKHNENNLILRFSAFNYAAQTGTFYSYKLEGYDNSWSEWSPYSFASYRNLKPGSYTFLLRAYSGNMQETECALPIVIRRPPWLSWWAWCLYAIALVLLTWIVVHYLKVLFNLQQRLKMEEELSEYKMLFFTNISHEFRTPLTIIRSSIDRIAGMDSLPNDLKQPVASLQLSTQRMLRLINQLLEFRMAQKGNLKLQVEETDIVAFTREIYYNFSSLAEHKKLQFEFHMSAKSLTIPIDRQHMDKTLYNLISNAIKYTPTGGMVSVRVYTENERLMIRVTDTGIGMNEEQRGKVFDNYMHTKFRSSNSMGIGLHFTRQLVELHHGTITYEPNTPSGSIFTVSLPMTMDAYSEEERLNDRQRALDAVLDSEPEKVNVREMVEQSVASSRNVPLNDRVVLIVDDDDDIRRYLNNLLLPFFQTRVAADGVDALHIAEEEQVDLIVSDVMMSTLDGYELTKRIRKNPKTNSIPIILLSALTSDEKRIRAIKLGADAYLTKPFHTQELLTRCQNLLYRHDQLRQSYAGETIERREVLPEIIMEERERKFIKDLDALIRSNMTNPNLSVEMLAEKLHFGRTMFFRQVKNLTGETPADYIRLARLRYAAELLSDANSEKLTVSEVSYRIGIDDPHYFIKLFKKQYGITPKKYQQGGQSEQKDT